MVSVYLEDYLVPPWESINILQSGDLVKVIRSRPGADETAETTSSTSIESGEDSLENEAHTSRDSLCFESELTQQNTSNWEEEEMAPSDTVLDTVSLRLVEVRLEKLTSIEAVTDSNSTKSKPRSSSINESSIQETGETPRKNYISPPDKVSKSLAKASKQLKVKKSLKVPKNTGIDIQCPSCGDRKSKLTFKNHLLTHYAKVFTPLLPSGSGTKSPL